MNALTRQCLGGRIAEVTAARRHVRPWSQQRNAHRIGVDWQFTNDNARIKLKRLYPKIVE